MRSLTAPVGMSLIALISAPAFASSGWAFGVVPYLWLPSVEGSVRYVPNGGAPSTPDVNVGDHLLENLSAAFMLGADARRDRWILMTDFIYMDFDRAETSLTGIAWTLNGGYRVLEGPVDLDVMGGVRYFGLKATTVFPGLDTVSARSDLWDGLFALRGRVHLGKSRWYLPYYADVGAGSSRLTWQAFGGVAYAFRWFDLSLTYRHISYDVGDDALIQGLTFTGPAFGFKFRF